MQTMLTHTPLINLFYESPLPQPQKGVLAVCPEFRDYPEGYAIGLGSIEQHPDSRATVLMGTKLFKYPDCGRILKDVCRSCVEFNDQAQICYGSTETHEVQGIGDGTYGRTLGLSS